MPEGSLSPLVFVADLDIEVGDERGWTTARLTTDDHGLVLEVVDPATLLRCVPGRGLRRDLPFSVPLARLADVPVRLTSRGRPDIGPHSGVLRPGPAPGCGNIRGPGDCRLPGSSARESLTPVKTSDSRSHSWLGRRERAPRRLPERPPSQFTHCRSVASGMPCTVQAARVSLFDPDGDVLKVTTAPFG